MTLAVLLAAAAGVLAAAAVVDLLATARGAARRGPLGARRAGRGHGVAGGRLGAMTVLLARIARRAGVRTAPADLPARISAAGAPLDLTASDVMALKGVGALTGLLLALTFASALPGRLGLVALLCAPAAGVLAPDLALARRARSRAARMSLELADVLDLLRVAVQAGLPVGRALSEVGSRCGGPVSYTHLTLPTIYSV